MRAREFVIDGADPVKNAIGAALPTAVSNIAPEFLKRYPQLAQVAALSPYAAQLVQQLATRQPTQAAVTALQNFVPSFPGVPKELGDLLSHWSNTGTVRGVAGHLAGDAVAAAGVLPSALSLPFIMAGQEQDKINADLWNPIYNNNPYAQQQRSRAQGGTQTQGQAGAQNARTAVRTQATPANPQPGTPEFAQLQQQYQR
jgi:hypothetical protein